MHFCFALSLFLFFLLFEHGILEEFTVDEANKHKERHVEDEDLSHEPKVALWSLKGARKGSILGCDGIRARIHGLEVNSLAVEENSHLHYTEECQTERRAKPAFHTCE